MNEKSVLCNSVIFLTFKVVIATYSCNSPRGFLSHQYAHVFNRVDHTKIQQYRFIVAVAIM